MQNNIDDRCTEGSMKPDSDKHLNQILEKFVKLEKRFNDLEKEHHDLEKEHKIVSARVTVLEK